MTSRFSCGVFVVVMGLLVGCGPRNEFQPPPPPEVEVGQPVVEDVTVYRAFPGRLQAVESVAILARVSGTLEEIAFTDGDMVDAGQVLFRIEKASYEADVLRAQAQLAQAESALSLANAALSRRQLAFETRAVSEIDLLTSEADVEAAQAAIQAAEAALAKAELNLSYTTVTAPIAGQVDRHRVSVGNVVGGPQSALLTTLVSVDPIDVYFSVDERSSIVLRRHVAESGEPATEIATNIQLELADGQLAEQTGSLDFAETQIDPATGTLMVRARFPNANALLVPGMFGRVRIPFNQPAALLIPEQAIQRDMSGPYVFVVQNDIAEQRYIELGPLADTRRVVTSGLSESDRVVVGGVQRVRPGSPLRVQAAAAGAE